MKSLEDIAAFNIEHADLELPEGSSIRRFECCTWLNCHAHYPNQNAILDAMNNKFTHADNEAAKSTLHKAALEDGVRRIMEENKLDAIIGPTDGPMASMAAAIGKMTLSGP